MGRHTRKRPPNWMEVGTRVKVHFPGATLDAEVVEDRGALGVGGRQLVRLRILGNTDFGEYMEQRAEDLEVVSRPGEEAA